MQTSRRIYFNPTSIYSLRTTRCSRRDFFNGGEVRPTRSGWRSNARRGIRMESTETGENQTGHISATSNEAILFFDSEVYTNFAILRSLCLLDIFPLKLTWLLRLPWQAERDLPDLLRRFNNQTLSTFEPLTLVKRAIPNSVPMKITEILPRLKDG
jgi:hypothetical protein